MPSSLGLPELESAILKNPVRVLLLGTGALGKSSVLERYLSQDLSARSVLQRTSGAETRPHVIRMPKSKRRLDVRLIDTTGQDASLVVLPGYLANCDAVCFMYDCTNRSSFEAVTSLYRLVKERAPPDVNGILVSTKNDVTADQRAVHSSEGVSLAEVLQMDFFETSALSGLNVEPALAALIKATALRLAIATSDLAALDALMPMPVEVAQREKLTLSSPERYLCDDRFSVLHYTCLFGGATALRKLIARKGHDLNAADSMGRTPLHITALKSQTLCARVLIAAGADPRLQDSVGRTPKDVAIHLLNDEMAAIFDKAVDKALYVEAMSVSRCSNKTCKLLILGPMGAGKTSLWRALRGNPKGSEAASSNAFGSRATVHRTCVFDSSTVMLSQLQELDGEGTGKKHVPRRPVVHTRSDPCGHSRRGTGGDNGCWLGMCFLSSLLSRTQAALGYGAEAQCPSTLLEKEMFVDEDTGDVAVLAWDLTGQDVSGPLQRMMVEGANVVVVCFDLFKGVYGREETLRDLAAVFGVIDGCMRPHITPDGHVHQDVLLVGTFRDALPLGEDERVMDDMSLAISRHLRGFATFSRICLPLASGRLFHAVGLGTRATLSTPVSSPAQAERQRAEVTAIREALCWSVAKSGALRRNWPSAWLRALQHMRSVPASPASTAASFLPAISRQQARALTERACEEVTAKPMDDATFAVMLRTLACRGEIMLLPDHVVVQPEMMLKIYQRLMEKCVLKTSTPTSRRRSQRGPHAVAPHLEPVVQHLRTTGVIEHEHLLELFECGSGSGSDSLAVDVSLQAMEKAGLIRHDEGLYFIPDIPLAMHEELFPFPVESPSVYDELSGKVLCYFHFHDVVPRGLLSLLVLHGSRFRRVEVAGLRFRYRPWSRPILARDHAEIPLNGYTLCMTVDHRRARISCAVSCREGAYLTPGLEAQVGLLLYSMLEECRRSHYERFRLELQVVDEAKVFAMTDVLLLHKTQTPRHPTGTANEDEDVDVEESGSVPRASSSLSYSGDGSGGNGGLLELVHVAHWADVFTHMPSCSYRPMPSALLHGTMASAAARSRYSQPWGLRIEGTLQLLEEGVLEEGQTRASGRGSSGQRYSLLPHPAPNRRRSQCSAYVALRELGPSGSMDGEPLADPSCPLWHVEPCKGGVRVRIGQTGGEMANWFLGLSNRAHRSGDGDVHAILTAEPSRAVIWDAVPIDEGSGERFELRVRWGSREVRYLSGGGRDPKHPDCRFVVVTRARKKRGRWNLEIPAMVESLNPYSMLSPLNNTGSLSGHHTFSLATPRGLELGTVRYVVSDLLKDMCLAVDERVVLAIDNDELDARKGEEDTTGAAGYKWGGKRGAVLASQSLSMDDDYLLADSKYWPTAAGGLSGAAEGL